MLFLPVLGRKAINDFSLARSINVAKYIPVERTIQLQLLSKCRTGGYDENGAHVQARNCSGAHCFVKAKEVGRGQGAVKSCSERKCLAGRQMTRAED